MSVHTGATAAVPSVRDVCGVVKRWMRYLRHVFDGEKENKGGGDYMTIYRPFLRALVPLPRCPVALSSHIRECMSIFVYIGTFI
jgi:hypothetical protein